MKGQYILPVAAFCLAVSIAPARALPLVDAAASSVSALAPTQVLVLGKDGRASLDEFASTHKLELDRVRTSHAASGLIQCGRAHGAGQLTLANDVVTTAAHVFFDERGAHRAKTCYFVTDIGGKRQRIAIDMGSVVAGATRPSSVKAVNDWAVARLTRPLDEIVPYELAETVAVDQPVDFVARGHSDWADAHRMSFESCRLRAQTNQAKSGSREFAFDCATADGASGGAVLRDDATPRLCAILVGWRSNDPSRISPFSMSNYNFVVSVEGAFRQALLHAAKREGAPQAPDATAGGAPGEKASNLGSSRRSARGS